MSCEYTTSPLALVLSGSARWRAWVKGTVSAAADDTFDAPISAVRFVATTAAGRGEVLS